MSAIDGGILSFELQEQEKSLFTAHDGSKLAAPTDEQPILANEDADPCENNNDKTYEESIGKKYVLFLYFI